MMNERIKKHHLISNSYFIGSILSAILLIYRLSIQPIVAVNNGKGWDGSFYYQMAVNIHAYVELPFRLRIGLPLLVHYIPVDNILYKFKLVNLVFSFLFSVITYVGISKYSKSTLAKIVAWFLICTTALSPIPMSTWYPVNSDVIPNFILVLVLLFVLSEKKSFFFLFVLFAIGSVFRENFPAFASLFLIQTQIVLAPSFISFLKKNININRLFLENKLHELTQNSSRETDRFALLFCDLDGFKEVNDKYGHTIGDRILYQVARRLSNNIRNEDILARYGGDEFVILISPLSDDSAICRIKEKVERSLSQPFDVSGNMIKVGVSIGTSIFPDETTDLPALLEAADQRMYDCKNQKS